jgi:hypothetical protein
MMVMPGVRAVAAAAALILPLWLGSCSLPLSANPAGTTAQPGSVPEPQPLPPPFPGATTEAPLPASAGSEIAASGPTAKPRTGGSITPQAGGDDGAAIIDDSGSVTGSASTAPGSPAAGRSGSSGSGNPAAPTKAADDDQAARGRLSGGTPVYFVALDDGGSSGVRFGCNDSLVAVTHDTAAAQEPLQAALDFLLGGSDPPEGLYNSLADSALKYVSAYFDGTTVVVNLTGTIRPGGTCDIPRLEAQLTHTAVSAVGAARAEIYVDGRRLADVLSLR